MSVCVYRRTEQMMEHNYNAHICTWTSQSVSYNNNLCCFVGSHNHKYLTEHVNTTSGHLARTPRGMKEWVRWVCITMQYFFLYTQELDMIW